MIEDVIDRFVIELGGVDSSDSEAANGSNEKTSGDDELAQPLPGTIGVDWGSTLGGTYWAGRPPSGHFLEK